MKRLRFAVVGAGFWARYQIAGWRELPGADCVALCNRTRSKAEALAREFGIPSVYEAVDELLEREALDFVDIVTGGGTHAPLVRAVAARGIPVICQKPLEELPTARLLVEECRGRGVPLLVHENWRWQPGIRALKKVLESGRLGPLVRARIDYANSFPVFENQPFLRELERFILTDIGTHILDTARCLFGEAAELSGLTRRTRKDIRGEDVATVLLRMTDDLTVTANMSYASRWEFDRFPETTIFVEGRDAGVTLGPGGRLEVFGEQGVGASTVSVPRYAWANPQYEVVHASIVACHRNLLAALRGEGAAETTGEDNLRTLELVEASYRSAAGRQVVSLP